jgi:hypothetical protein
MAMVRIESSVKEASVIKRKIFSAMMIELVLPASHVTCDRAKHIYSLAFGPGPGLAWDYSTLH